MQFEVSDVLEWQRDGEEWVTTHSAIVKACGWGHTHNTASYSVDWMRWHSQYTCMYRHYCGHISHCATLHCMQLRIVWRPLPLRWMNIKWTTSMKSNWNQIQLKRLLTSQNNKMTSKSSTLYVCIGTSLHMYLYKADATMICLCRIAKLGLCCCVL